LDFHAIETKKENDWALRGADLEEALAELQAKGKKPFILSALSDLSLWTLCAR
jgi:aromatic-L-amino-acid decarboxylase